jgi:hypothetical protein
MPFGWVLDTTFVDNPELEGSGGSKRANVVAQEALQAPGLPRLPRCQGEHDAKASEA